MRKELLLIFTCLLLFSCKSKPDTPDAAPPVVWEPYDETVELEEQAQNENPRLQFKLLNSKVSDKNTIWESFEEDLANFSEERYNELKPLIMEKDIPSLQSSINNEELTYTDLTLFYLYRIRKYESDNSLSLNAIISLNPNVVEQARKLDEKRNGNSDEHSLYGMPILLKDNINARGMSTTAGAVALEKNQTENAFIVERLRNANALILGKANLSEWAYYFCNACPLGYSAVGGQTLNPYGRKIFETGGSSSGSAVAVAANYAVAAVGTETAGSILSPSSKNAVVGLKPTVGLLSRTGIVPISSTLDTPGPISRTLVDNAILLQAMTGEDSEDEASVPSDIDYLANLENASVKGKRLGVMKGLMADSLYSNAVEKLESLGATVVEFEAPQVPLDGFLTLLNIDMKHDLPKYLEEHAGKGLEVMDIADVIAFNLRDTLVRAPYGQGLFEGIMADSTSLEELEVVKNKLQENGRRFFDEPMARHNLDAVLSIDNYHAAFAAVAKYPAIAVPMGFSASGEPKSLTFIAKQFEEDKLLQLGFAYERASKARKAPGDYE